MTLTVASRNETNQRLLRALAGKSQGAFISFETPELLFKVLSGQRWELLRAMQGAGTITLWRHNRGQVPYLASTQTMITTAFGVSCSTLGSEDD